MKAIPETLTQPTQQTTYTAKTVAANDHQVYASWRDYLELCKPNVVALMILTSVIGMMLASPAFPHWKVMLFGNLGIALMAASAAVINHVVDRKIDPIMFRTRNRPLAKGKVEVANALLFSMLLGVSGMVLLITQINPLTAWLTFASLIGYAVVYTLFLKRATPQNIVIGGLAGAAPPLLGWTSVTGVIEPNSLLLVLIIFAWTPPHFWALAIHRKAEYAKADIPMLPVTHGEAYTKVQILLYTLILLAISVFPFITGMSGYLYLVSALALGARFIYWAVAMIRNSRAHAAINTFKYSITYLMLLFLALLADHYLIAYL
ncbi:heme o synthase [Alkalimarinus sediminis]|uniref:Protoheme IX farnesyltransferase n=1 Tax=Alkalimarinus sediminis TaxID=1632866 RepID=A0A9E8KP53_9ALTE|nr:heme o synthase [Alkalimarinus sediminis]UZW75068.1 heme o synthase [Alkalimarinus sediminis]